MSDETTAADAIARRLYEAGCRHAFGIPGSEVLTMMNALRAAGIAFHLAKHENAAGFMAEGTHHVTGAPAILLATIGPGAANAVNVTVNAWQDRVPLIVRTGCVDEEEALTYSHQVFDHRELFRPITKASFRLGVGRAAVQADKAVALATDPRPGPVHIDLPISLAAKPTSTDGVAGGGRVATPSVLVGLDTMDPLDSHAVADFAQRFSMPVITSYKAKGVLPEVDPLALGAAGLLPTADDFESRGVQVRAPRAGSRGKRRAVVLADRQWVALIADWNRFPTFLSHSTMNGSSRTLPYSRRRETASPGFAKPTSDRTQKGRSRGASRACATMFWTRCTTAALASAGIPSQAATAPPPPPSIRPRPTPT